MFRSISFWSLMLVLALSSATSAQTPQPAGHGPKAADNAFLSHDFQLAPHVHERPELAFHFGLIQPIMFHGINVAVDVRFSRFLLSYSHGAALNLSANPSFGLDATDRRAGVDLYTPWTTGGGVGVTLLDELYVMADLKVHRFEASLDGDHAKYTTMSAGAELGYRLFLWRGLYAQAVLRYWPNVFTTLKGDRTQLGAHTHHAKDFGAFANMMLGWAFDV